MPHDDDVRTHARGRVFGIGRWDWRATVGIEVTGTTTTESRRGSDDFGGIAWPARSRDRLPQKVWAARRVHIGLRAPRRSRVVLFSSGPLSGTFLVPSGRCALHRGSSRARARACARFFVPVIVVRSFDLSLLGATRAHVDSALVLSFFLRSILNRESRGRELIVVESGESRCAGDRRTRVKCHDYLFIRGFQVQPTTTVRILEREEFRERRRVDLSVGSVVRHRRSKNWRVARGTWHVVVSSRLEVEDEVPTQFRSTSLPKSAPTDGIMCAKMSVLQAKPCPRHIGRTARRLSPKSQTVILT